MRVSACKFGVTRNPPLPVLFQRVTDSGKPGQWPDLWDWALDFMRERARTGESQQARLGELISVLLHENLGDEA